MNPAWQKLRPGLGVLGSKRQQKNRTSIEVRSLPG
jgi:hypothetical protein